MTKEDSSGEEPGTKFSASKRRDLFLSEYLANSNEERQDVIFRRVRGILNKITPETFDKLSKDLVNVGLDSPRTLRGLIYLLFDKALKDLKYSSLYAKLCQKLSEKSPNFEKEPGPNTFCKFLISKCEDEFERRRKANEDFERKNELTDEEFEQKVIAKQKMLGNIKFICELGKKRLLQEEILHECIRGLLSRKKERTLQDQAQDLECLCQIMRTIGSLLDVEASRNLMNQYFERIDMYSRKQELPSRIRFMLRDVIDLRNNNWRPRPFQREDNVPQPLSKLREEASFSNVASSAPIDKIGNTKNLMNINKLNVRELSTLLDDEPGFTTTTDFHWGASPFLPHENEFDIFSVNQYTQPGKAHAVNPIKTAAHNPASLQTSSSTVSNNPNSKFQVSNNSLAPRFLQSSRFDAFAGQNHFDTFVRVPQLANNPRSNQEADLTSSNLKDNLRTKRNENIDSRYSANRRYDKRSVARDGPVTSQSQMPLSRLSPTSKMDTNELDVNAAISQPSVREQHLRCNNSSRINATPHRDLEHQQLQQPQYRPPPRHLNVHGDDESHRPPSELSKPLPSVRNNDKLMAHRNAPTQRDQSVHESLPLPPPPPHSRSLSSRGLNQEQQIHQFNQRQNQGAMLNGGSRSRRFERGHDYEPRQPKFSGANYRLPGRERPQPQVINRNSQPESDLNMNWRSTEATRTTTQPPADDKAERKQLAQSNSSRQILPDSSERPSIQRIPDDESIVVDNCSDMDEAREPGGFDSEFNRKSLVTRIDRNSSVVKSRTPPHSENLVNDVNYRFNPLQSARVMPNEAKHFSNRDPPPRFTNNNSNTTTTNNNNNNNNNNKNHNHNNNGSIDYKKGENDTNNMHRSRRSHHDDLDSRSNKQKSGFNNHQQNLLNANHRDEPRARTDSTDKHEPKRPEDHQRRQRPFSPLPQSGSYRHENDNKHQNSRFSESQSSHERRGYRPPPMGRNQSFEGHNVLDSKRGPNRRNEDLNQANNSSTKKDLSSNPTSIISAHHQVLSRLPIPMSAADFSLRPSHNLMGRPVAETSNKMAEKNDDQAQEKATVSGQTDISTSKRPSIDNSVQVPDVKESTETSIQIEPKEQRTPIKSQINDANQYISKFMKFHGEYLDEISSDGSKVNPKLKDIKLPRDLHETCLVHAMKHTISRTEQDREKTGDLFCQLIPSIFESIALLNAFKSLFEQMNALEVETPKAKSLVAGFLSRAVVDDLLTIEDVAQVLIGGKHHPLFLLFLQKLEKKAGQAWLSEKFIASKINLMDMLPEVDRTKERLASALKDRCLGFLDPMLTIEPDLWAQMKDKDPSPAAVYRWIKDNVDQTILNTPTFAHVFISCLLKYIHNSVVERPTGRNVNNQHQKDSESSDSSKSSPTNSSSQVAIDQEKEILSRYQQMMHAILKDKQMQLATLYALQLFYHGLNFPKGALLRWFHMLYDLSIVDDDVFFIWKEEINDTIPGKGQALFQVNTWLNWLAEPDSEDEEDA